MEYDSGEGRSSDESGVDGGDAADGPSDDVTAMLADHAGYDDTIGLGDPPVVTDPWCQKLVRVIDGLADEPVSGVNDGDPSNDAQILAQLRDLNVVIDRLEAQRLRRLRAADTAGVLARDGYANPAVWLRTTANLTAVESARRAKVARRLDRLPVIAAALADGRIGVAHASLIERMATDVGINNVIAVQAPLVVAATELRDVKQFADLCTGWRHALAPDDLNDRDNDAYHRRRAGFDLINGIGHLWGTFDAEAAALIATAIDAYTTHDDADTPPDARRTRPQRVADAITDMAARLLDTADAPINGRQHPHVNVTIPTELLTGTPGAPAATADWIGAIGRDTALRILDHSCLTRILLDQASQPLDVGTATRIWPTGICKAIRLRDNHCRFPGCDRPNTWCDIDHVIQVEDGGPTSVSNGILLCRVHHRMKHPNRWWPTLHPDATITWTHPSYEPRTTHPASYQQHWIDTLTDHPHTTNPDTTNPDNAKAAGQVQKNDRDPYDPDYNGYGNYDWHEPDNNDNDNTASEAHPIYHTHPPPKNTGNTDRHPHTALRMTGTPTFKRKRRTPRTTNNGPPYQSEDPEI